MVGNYISGVSLGRTGKAPHVLRNHESPGPASAPRQGNKNHFNLPIEAEGRATGTLRLGPKYPVIGSRARKSEASTACNSEMFPPWPTSTKWTPFIVCS